MSLKLIRAKIAAETGFHPESSDDDKNYLNLEINNIANDLYSEHDLVGSLKEIIIFFELTAKLVSLPSYVGEVRASRYYDSPFILTLRDIRPRYSSSGFTKQILDPREIGVSTLFNQITNASVLKFSLPEGEVESTDLEIDIIGATPVSTNIQEKLILIAGQNTITSINNWVEAPTSILKNRYNSFDILVTDIEDNELALIPNSELNSRYKVFQVRDDNLIGQISANSLEVLYKEAFIPLVNDNDEFLKSIYDEVLFWKFLYEYWSKQEGKESLAESAREMLVTKFGIKNRDNQKGKKSEMQYVDNKFYSLFDRASRRIFN